jgi:hypothetical protein
VNVQSPGIATNAAADTRSVGWRRAVRRRLTPEHALVLLLGLLVLAVHDVGYMLRQPYWNDEAWVAVTTRFPLSQLLATTSSTPVGWSLLARVLTFGRSESARMLTLVFAGAAVMTGYWLARRLDWKDRVSAVTAGVLAGCGVLLVPAMLVRDDLKQYTADAFLAVLILAVTARLERRWSRAGLAALSAAVWGGMLVSHTAAFVGAAAFCAVLVVQLARRAWRRVAEAAVAAGCTAALALAVYEGFDARAMVPGLTVFWRRSFLPVNRGAVHGAHFIVHSFSDIHPYLGLGPSWLAIPLVLAGLVTIAALGRPATAIACVVLWPEMLALSALRRYPFLDLRTSTFLIVITAVVAAIGVTGIGAAVRGWLRDGPVAAVAAGAIAVIALTAFGIGARPYVRSHLIPFADVRDQARYVAAHAGPHDPIVVNLNSNWAFGYYWPVGKPWHTPDSAVLQGYVAYFPDQPRIIVARNRDAAAVAAAMTQAMSLVRPGTCVRIWLVRSHVVPREQVAWTIVLRRLRLTAANAIDGLSYVRFCAPSGSAPAGVG